LTWRKGLAGTFSHRVSLSAVTALPHDPPSGAPLDDLQVRMVEAVAGGGGLAAVARLAAEATGGSVAIVAPADGADTIAPQAADWPAAALASLHPMPHGAIGLCAQQPDHASWVAPMIAEQFPAAPLLQEDGVVWALLPARRADDPARATTAAAQRVAARLGTHTAVGLSPFTTGPERLRDALRQARIVLELARSGQIDVEEATTGTWRLLLAMAVSHPDELATCVATSIGPAVDHDARLRTELVATFRAYLDHDANMNATASAIFAHRHTVAARLERMGALTRLDPMRHEDRERLGVGLKAQAVLTAASSSAISH
jgi:hypothetical protein